MALILSFPQNVEMTYRLLNFRAVKHSNVLGLLFRASTLVQIHWCVLAICPKYKPC